MRTSIGYVQQTLSCDAGCSACLVQNAHTHHMTKGEHVTHQQGDSGVDAPAQLVRFNLLQGSSAQVMFKVSPLQI